jgi:dTDP-glucose 4,6-dehydratase
MARMLVTGGAGFIGTNFVHHWAAQHPGERLVVVDALTYAGKRENLQSLSANRDFLFVHADIRDSTHMGRVLREQEIDTIVHFAADSHVDRSISGPDCFIETNIVGTHSLLKAARTVWLEQATASNHRFHHVSTDEVYGSLGPNESAFHERTPYAPNSPYSASKAASDHLVRSYYKTYGLKASISNCSNNYGPYQLPEKLIPLVIVNILEGRAVPLYGDGRNRRDWLHVSDHCRGIDSILRFGQPGAVYNIGGGCECDNHEIVGMICAIADELFRTCPDLRSRFPRCPAAHGRGTSSLIEFVAERPGHDRRYAIDSGKIERELGFRVSVPLTNGLRDTFSWYLQNERWWRAAVDDSYREPTPARLTPLNAVPVMSCEAGPESQCS